MRKKIVVILNIILIILMSIGLFLMFSKHAQRSPEAFIERGFRNFRYFTVLSNVYSGLVAVVYIILLICKSKAKDGTLMSILKLTSSAAVGVTFTVVIIFLGPLYGFGRMYAGSNLIFHLIMPLAAMAEFVVFPAFESGKENAFSLKKCLYAGIPVVLYGSVYLINNILNGSGEASPNNTDFYGFLRWGYPAGILIFIVIVFIAVGITCLLRWIKKKTSIRTGPRSMPVR
ncbi:MAG: hypothetical protein IJL20_14270 [Lachnospiraceae bacterium]|nr:hypothetical protein [Lachnospiraceae bacterium]